MQSHLGRGRAGNFCFLFASVYLLLDLVLLDGLLFGLAIWGFVLIKSVCCLLQAIEKAFCKYAY